MTNDKQKNLKKDERKTKQIHHEFFSCCLRCIHLNLDFVRRSRPKSSVLLYRPNRWIEWCLEDFIVSCILFINILLAVHQCRRVDGVRIPADRAFNVPSTLVTRSYIDAAVFRLGFNDLVWDKRTTRGKQKQKKADKQCQWVEAGRRIVVVFLLCD